jgi:biotin carboxyl carrier protein
MQYDLRIGDSEKSVDASPMDEQSSTTLTLDDTAHELRLTALPPHHLQIIEAGRGEDLFVARCDEGMWVWSQGRARLVSDAAAQKTPRRGGPGDPAGDVTPPMPAVVQEILIEVGQTVEKGARLVVVSAMKMETTLVAPHPGTVTAVNTEVGAKVAPGDILVEIQKTDDDGEDGDNHE